MKYAPFIESSVDSFAPVVRKVSKDLIANLESIPQKSAPSLKVGGMIMPTHDPAQTTVRLDEAIVLTENVSIETVQSEFSVSEMKVEF